MVQLGGLRKGIELNEVVDVLWFYFGYWSGFRWWTTMAARTSARKSGWPTRQSVGC